MEPADTLPHELDDAACKRALATLIDVGTALALECKAAGSEATLAARCAAYEKVALAVRRAILLAQHLKSAPVVPKPNPTQTRKEIIRKVEDTIELKAKPSDAAALRIELIERLDSPDFADDLANRTPAELINELCSDLGLAIKLGDRAMHRRRTPADIAILCAQAAVSPTAKKHRPPLPEETTPPPRETRDGTSATTPNLRH